MQTRFLLASFSYIANTEIMRRVQLLQDALGKAIVIAKEATQRIEEFQIQLSILQRQCSARDRPFCDTLRLRGFEDNGILNTLTRVIRLPLISDVRHLFDLFIYFFFLHFSFSRTSFSIFHFHFLHIHLILWVFIIRILGIFWSQSV